MITISRNVVEPTVHPAPYGSLYLALTLSLSLPSHAFPTSSHVPSSDLSIFPPPSSFSSVLSHLHLHFPQYQQKCILTMAHLGRNSWLFDLRSDSEMSLAYFACESASQVLIRPWSLLSLPSFLSSTQDCAGSRCLSWFAFSP